MSKDIFRIGDRVVIQDYPYEEEWPEDLNGRKGTVIELPLRTADGFLVDSYYDVQLDEPMSDGVAQVLCDPLELMRIDG